MQYILTEEELNRGCELIESWATEEMSLEKAYVEQESLNAQGYFTVIKCNDLGNEMCKIIVYRRND